MSVKKKIDNLIGVALLIVAVVLAFFIGKTATGSDIWYDEVFSMMFIKGSFADIVSLTARDVHPPLYYFYLKVCVALFGGFGAITAAKLASVLPLFIIIILSATYIRKRFGCMAMGIYSLLMTFMPQLASYYVEIRMYSFAMLLITICFCAFIEIAEYKNDSKLIWLVFWLAGILTAYTQYFACVAIIAVYFLLFLNGIINKLDKKYWIKLVCSVAFSVLAYIPWLLVFKKQLENVAGSYWIQPMTLRSLPGCIKFIFLPVSGEGNIVYVATALMLGTIGLAYILFLVKKPGIRDSLVALGGPCAIGMIIVVGYLFSVTGNPIFTYRYMIPALGMLYLGIVFTIIKCKKRWIIYLAIVSFSFGGYYSLKNFYYDEGMKASHFAEANERLAQIEKDSVIVTNFDHVTAVSSYYMPDAKVYIYEGETDKLIRDLFNGCEFVNNEEVAELVKNNSNVYFLGSFVSRDEIVADWEKYGIKSEYINECMIERYWFNIYKLSANE